MRTHSVNGIVLRRIDLGEKDRILTIYTKEQGKLSAVAKGARRPGSRLAGACEPFTCSKMLLASGRDLDVLTQAEIKESFPNTKRDMRGIAHAVYMLELVGQFVDERQPNPELFDTLLSAMYILEGGTDPEVTTRYFELQLLSLMGYDPHFEECLKCGKPIGKDDKMVDLQVSPPGGPPARPGKDTWTDKRVAFSPSLGGVVCGECGVPPNDVIWVPGAAASWVRALREVEPHRLKDLNVPKGARRDIGKMLRYHIRYRLERDLKSVEFIEFLGKDLFQK